VLDVVSLARDAHRVLGATELGHRRLEGVRSACLDLGLDAPDVRTVPLDASAAADAVRAWADAGVTGVCAYNDEVAMAVLAGARLAGVGVPDRLAVVGVDDVPVARLTSPPLTTVTTDQKPVADYIAGLVVRSVTGGPAPRRPGSDIVHLVRRESA